VLSNVFYIFILAMEYICAGLAYLWCYLAKSISVCTENSKIS